MKRFYQLLFIVTVLVNGNTFGMENKIEIGTLSQCSSGIMNKMRSSSCFVGSALQLDKLNIIIQKATYAPLICTEGDIRIIMGWVQIFDDSCDSDVTGYENLLYDTLGAIIQAKNAQGLTFQMQPWENIILEKGLDLQGLSKEYIDILRQKEQIQDELLALQKQANKVVCKIFIKLSVAVKYPNEKNDQELDKLLQDKLGVNTPLSDYLDYINTEIRENIQYPPMADGNEVQLNNLWNTKFNTLFVQEHLQQQVLVDQQLQIEQQEKALQLKIEQINLSCWLEYLQGDQEQSSENMFESFTLEELLNQHKLQNVNLPIQQQQNQPDIEGGQPRPDELKGVAVLCAAIAPKLAIMAVVVGVGYWGYKKYTAYKATQVDEQESAAVETMADKEKQK